VGKLQDEIRSCHGCGLYKGCTGPVPYTGRPGPLMIIGEAPGRSEDRQGRPFVGPAGKLLWEELGKNDVERIDCFVANAVSCYPGRTPTPDEVFACRANLYHQVLRCQPYAILALGRTANQSLGKDEAMGKMHGDFYWLPWFARNNGRRIKVIPTYHPAAVLRNRLLTRVFRTDVALFANQLDLIND
jgi:uracil-DNA glycosylase